MRYQNKGSKFFRFVTKHARGRQTDRKITRTDVISTDKTALAVRQRRALLCTVKNDWLIDWLAKFDCYVVVIIGCLSIGYVQVTYVWGRQRYPEVRWDR